MNRKEQEFIAGLSQLSECLRPHNPWWYDKLLEDSANAQALLDRNADVVDRYDLVRIVLSYYESGMGGLHESTPEECAEVKTLLFETTNDLLRKYWKELGREWHDYSSYEIIPDGTNVKLVPKAIIYLRPGFPPTKVPDTRGSTEQIWFIVRGDGPDVTNMPSYLIHLVSGSTFRSARHEALEVIDDSSNKVS